MGPNPSPPSQDFNRLGDPMGIDCTQMMGDNKNNPTHPDYERVHNKLIFKYCFSAPFYFLCALLLQSAYQGFSGEDLITDILVILSGFFLGLLIDGIVHLVKRKRKQK